MDQDGYISIYDPSPIAREAHKDWANEVKAGCEDIKNKAGRIKPEIEVYTLKALSLNDLATEGKLSFEGLLKFTEELEEKARQLRQQAEQVECEAHIHVETNIDDRDYLLPKRVRDGRNNAMIEMFDAVEETQEASRTLENTVLNVQEKLNNGYKVKATEPLKDDPKELA